MTFQAFLESDACVRLGWTLLHSLWQLGIIGALAATMLACLRSRARYAVAYFALLLMAAAPVATYFVVTPPAPPLEVADVASETSPIALTAPEPRVQPVEPSVVEMEFDVARNGSPRSPAPLEMRELPSESETLAPPLIEVVGLSPVPEPEPTPTTERANEPAPPSLARRSARASAWLAPFWLTGVILLALRHLGGWVLSHRLLCSAAPLDHIELHRRLEGLIQKMGVRRAVRLLQSTLADAPMVLGVMRPALIAPVSLVTGLSPTQWEAILAHELAHIRRHDYLMNLVQIVIETLLFYHPAAWWLSRRIRAEREDCCDDIAAEYCGSPVALAEGLAAIEAARLKNGATDLAVAAVGPGSQDSTLRRVRRILGLSDGNAKRDRTWLAGLLVLTLLIIAGVVGHRAGAQVDGSSRDTRAEGEDDVVNATKVTIDEAGADSQPELAGDAVSKILPLRTNGSISLYMKSSAGGRNGIAQLPWIAFPKTEGVLRAELQARLISFPKGKWLVTLDLLSNEDEHAEPLASADAIFENSGIVKGLPSTSTRFLRWRLGSEDLAEQATHFRVTLSPSTEPGVRQSLPLLDGTSIPFLLESTPGGQGATATLSEIAFTTESGKLRADLRGSVISWPKAGWRIVVELLSSDTNAEPVASAEAMLANSGRIISKPGLETRELQMALGDQSQLQEAVVVRVSIIPSAEQASARPVDVEGQVLDAEDKPIEALLVVRTIDGRFSPAIASDSDGRFTIPSCPSTRVALLALAKGGGFGPAAQIVDAREGMEPLTPRLTAKRELRVRAADQFNKPVAPGGLRIGVPLAGATGEEEQYFWLSSPYDELLADVLPETVLDASGCFAWDAAPDGPLALQVSGANHGETEIFVPTDFGGQVGVVMKRPVATLIANARLESGGPSAPTKIQLWPEVDHSIRFPQPGRGVIDIYENRPEYVYRITAEGYVPMTHKVLLKDVLEWSYYPITTPDGNIEYRPSRRPIGDSDSAIAATPVPSPWKARSIGNDGLRVAAPFTPVCLTPGGETAVDADVCVQGYGKFGNSFRKAIVNNGHADSAFGTDEQGRAIIPAYFANAGMTDRPAGGIVILHDSGYKILTRAEFAAADRITLDPWGRITGQYTVGGEPREGRELWLTAEPHADETVRELFRVKDHETTDAEARFTFERLLPGTYSVAGPDETQTIEVKPGESVTVNIEIATASPPTPPLPGSLNVAVTTDDSHPDAPLRCIVRRLNDDWDPKTRLAGRGSIGAWVDAKLSWRDSPATPKWETLRNLEAHANQTVQIDGLPTGRYRVSVERRVPSPPTGDIVETSAALAEITDLAPHADVDIHVQSKHEVGLNTLTGRSIPGVVVVLTPTFLCAADGFIGKVAADGTYRIENLPAGDYLVQLNNNDSENDTYLTMRLTPITISGDAKIDLPSGTEARPAQRTIPVIDGMQTVPLELGAMLPLEIKSDACDDEGVAQLTWVMLKNEEAQLKASVRLLLLSAPKGTWRVTTELLSDNDEAKPLAIDRAVFENSGMILGEPLLTYRDLRFSLGSAELLDQATRIRVSIEQVSTDTETTGHMQEAEELPYAYRIRRATTYKFLKALFANRSMSAVEDATGLSWPRSHMDISESFAKRAGQFERPLSYRMVRTTRGQYMEARCQWKKAVMLVRVTFDDTGELVTGFWLARDKEGPTPAGFKRGGYIIGRPMMKIAGLGEEHYNNLHGLAIHARTVDEKGELVAAPSRTILWKRTLDPNARAYSSADLIVDSDGAKWQHVAYFNRNETEHTFANLATGIYRLTADHLAARTVMSEDIRVDGAVKQVNATLTIPKWERIPCRLSARLIDAESSDALAPFEPFFKLYRFGFPCVSYRYDNKYEEGTNDADYTCELLPGVYQVDVYGACHSIGERSRALDKPTRLSFTVTDRGPNDFTFDIPSRTFDEADEEVAQRWPNVVEGIVQTADGEPIEGADVHVHGRPEERAWTTTDADGHYSLRFAPRYYTTANTAADLFKRGQLDVYANAIVHVKRPGFVEANLARQGRFTVVEEAPLDKDGNPLAPERTAVRGKPFHDINFTMVPAARIYANFFRDQDGKPMDRQLALVNADNPELRRYEQDSAVDHFEGVPTVGRWRFYTYHEPSGPHFDSSLSPVMSFPTPGSYHAYLQAVEIPEEERSNPKQTLRLKLLSLIDPNGREVAPSPETHMMVDGKREPLHSPVRIGETSEEN